MRGISSLPQGVVYNRPSSPKAKWQAVKVKIFLITGNYCLKSQYIDTFAFIFKIFCHDLEKIEETYHPNDYCKNSNSYFFLFSAVMSSVFQEI